MAWFLCQTQCNKGQPLSLLVATVVIAAVQQHGTIAPATDERIAVAH
jgi:hypothetical protein